MQAVHGHLDQILGLDAGRIRYLLRLRLEKFLRGVQDEGPETPGTMNVIFENMQIYFETH